MSTEDLMLCWALNLLGRLAHNGAGLPSLAQMSFHVPCKRTHSQGGAEAGQK